MWGLLELASLLARLVFCISVSLVRVNFSVCSDGGFFFILSSLSEILTVEFFLSRTVHGLHLLGKS